MSTGYVDEISEILGIDPWHLMTSWFVSEDKCLEKETCRQILAAEVDEFLAELQLNTSNLESKDNLWLLSKMIEELTD